MTAYPLRSTPHTSILTHISRDDLVDTAIRMEREGGSFSSALGTLLIVADGTNKAKLCNAFGDVILQYRKDA